MYRTSQGERTLWGAERRLFAESLAMIVDYLSEGDYSFGIAVLDDLQRNQKIAVLLGVSKSLLRDNVAPPPLTAVSEAAVAGVYQHMQDLVADEITACDLVGEERARGGGGNRCYVVDPRLGAPDLLTEVRPEVDA